MDCPKDKGSEATVACLPDDALEGILSRLRAKPLSRFKCVSKGWCGLIADRLCCCKFPQTLAGFFNGGPGEKYGDFIDLSGRPVPLVDPTFSFLTKAPDIEKIVLLGSCNGLVLFGHRRVSDTYNSLGYIVCNPATEQWVTVPSSGWSTWDDGEDEENQGDVRVEVLDAYLIFDPSVSPHFQLVQVQLGALNSLEEAHNFSSVTGAWKRHEGRSIVDKVWSKCGIYIDSTNSSVGCLFNGMLHLCSYCSSEARNMIVGIDGEGKASKFICGPENCGLIVFMGQSQGLLYCVSVKDPFEMTELSIWVLEDYDAEKWILNHNLSSSQLFGRMQCSLISDVDVVAIHPYHGLVFFFQYRDMKLISYDMDRKEVHDVCTLGHGCCRFVTPYVPYFAESALLAKKR
ncbi:unnamed protein product [Urochloa decumbens]|uniref:F-box domain-containing protein n=1 Tax=Urochloa decumbens TaxID=240449 RepID=A0ABC9H6I9_9POAL